jgi:hypothetical protein
MKKIDTKSKQLDKIRLILILLTIMLSTGLGVFAYKFSEANLCLKLECDSSSKRIKILEEALKNEKTKKKSTHEEFLEYTLQNEQLSVSDDVETEWTVEEAKLEQEIVKFMKTFEGIVISLITSDALGFAGLWVATQRGYAQLLEKINKSMQKPISGIQVLELLEVASLWRQFHCMKPLLQLQISEDGRDANPETVREILKFLVPTIVSRGDVELAELFFHKYGSHMIVVEYMRFELEERPYIYDESLFGKAKEKAFTERKFEILKCLQECENHIQLPSHWSEIGNLLGYKPSLRSRTYHEFERLLELDEREMARFYFEKVDVATQEYFIREAHRERNIDVIHFIRHIEYMKGTRIRK